MSLIPRSLITEFQNTIDDLTQHWEDGGLSKNCQLIFEGGITSSSDITVDNIGNKPKSMLSYGGRSHSNTITGHENISNEGEGGAGLKEQEYTKVIQARVYPVNKPYLRISLGVSINQNIWQINAHKKYMPDLIRAKEIIIDTGFSQKRIRVRPFKPPIPYGLGEAYQCVSYWEEIQ